MMIGLKKSANQVLEAVVEMNKNKANYGSYQAPMKKDKEVRNEEKAERQAEAEASATDVEFTQEHPTPNENEMWREPEANG